MTRLPPALVEAYRSLTCSCFMGLFPEILKSELHGVRSVIEAYSKSAKLAGRESASACGIMMASGAPLNRGAAIRVTSGSVVSQFQIDRWD